MLNIPMPPAVFYSRIWRGSVEGHARDATQRTGRGPFGRAAASGQWQATEPVSSPAELRTRSGHRIITKIKHKDFTTQ